MAEESASRARYAWLVRYRIILYFALGLAGIDVAVAAGRSVWRSYDPDDYRERVRGCRQLARDLVFIGGSPVSEGIDPAIFAGLCWQGQRLERVYNMGLPGATTADVWHAVEHGLAAPPRLLVYGITASDVNDARREPHGPRSLMDARDVARWIRYRPGSAEWCLRYFSEASLSRLWNLYYFRNGIRLWAVDQIERLRPGVCPEAAAEARDGLRYWSAIRSRLGFAPRPEFQARSYEQLKAAGLRWTTFHFLENYRPEEYLSYLHRLIDWAEEHRVALVLVDVPVSADIEETLYPAVYARYRAVLTDLERVRGVRVLRAPRDVIGLTDAHFADLIHLNAQGTPLFSEWLRAQLTDASSSGGDRVDSSPAHRGQGGTE
jgi:hypothetical protein